MSAYTTITMTKEQAVQYILSNIATADNSVLEQVADILLAPQLYNLTINSHNPDLYGIAHKEIT